MRRSANSPIMRNSGTGAGGSGEGLALGGEACEGCTTFGDGTCEERTTSGGGVRLRGAPRWFWTFTSVGGVRLEGAVQWRCMTTSRSLLSRGKDARMLSGVIESDAWWGGCDIERT